MNQPSQTPTALSLAVSSVSFTGPGALDPLKFVPGLANAFIARLSDPPFGFAGQVRHDLGATAINDAVEAALRADVTGRVVHFIGHGVKSENDLHIFGADGLLTTPLGQWTREQSALLREQDALHTVPTLFLVDACFAGTSIYDQLFHMNDDLSIHKWVIAASGGDETAFDGRLTRAFGNILDRLRKGELDLAPDEAFLKFMALTERVREEVNRLSGEGPRQTVRNTRPEIDGMGVFPLFPNPAYVAIDGPQPGPSLTPFLESLAFDATHWRTRAAGTTDTMQSSAFAGREPELARLTTFLDDPEACLALVTGAPGSGKSAILGLLVCNVHPNLHEQTREIWEPASAQLPGLRPTVLAVHARRLGLQEVVESLAGQLGGENVDGPQGLINMVEALDDPPIVVLDALDEATPSSISSNARSGISELVDGLILPALRRRRPDGRPAMRLVLGSRKWIGEVALDDIFGDFGPAIDLDDVPPGRLFSELKAYSEKRLSSAFRGWRDNERSLVADNLAGRLVMADRTTGFGSHFLCAAVFISSLVNEAPGAVPAALQARKAPTSLPELLKADLKRQSNRKILLSILRAIALSKGAGAPISIIAEIAGCLDKGSAPLEILDLQLLLRETLSFYLRTSSDVDGSLLYRLFHQGIVDYLLDLPTRSAIGKYIANRVADSGSLGMPYFQRHLIEHASDVDRMATDSFLVASLWNDANFLAAAVPSIARTYPPTGKDREARRAWEVHSWCRFTSDMTRLQRLSVLTATASRWRDDELRAKLALTEEMPFVPRWGTLKERTEQIYNTSDVPRETPYMSTPDHIYNDPSRGFYSASATDPNHALAVWGWSSGEVSFRENGEEVRNFRHTDAWISCAAISRDGKYFAVGDHTGAVRIYDTIERVIVRHFKYKMAGSRVTALAVGGPDHFAAGFTDGEVVALDGMRTRRIHHQDTRWIAALVASRDFGRIYAAYGSGELIAWDPTFDVVKRMPVPATDRVADEIDGERPSIIRAMALSDDDRLLLTGADNGYFRRWEAAAGRPLGDPIRASDSALAMVGFGADGASIFTGDQHTQRRWDLFSSAQLEEDAGESGRIASVVIQAGRLIHVGYRSTAVYSVTDGLEVSDDWQYEERADDKKDQATFRRALAADWVGVDRSSIYTVARNGSLDRWIPAKRGEWHLRHLANLSISVVGSTQTREGFVLLDGVGALWKVENDKVVQIDTPPVAAVGPRRGGIVIGLEDGTLESLSASTMARREILASESASPTVVAGVGSNSWVGRQDGSLTLLTGRGRSVELGRQSDSPPVAIWPIEKIVVVVRTDGTIEKFSRDGASLASTRTDFTVSASHMAEDGTLALANAQDVLVLDGFRRQ